MASPAVLLDLLGVPWVQVTDPGYGYDGSFTPRCAFGHWCASAAGSDTSEDVLWGRHYHACVSREGIVKLGGVDVRQGHGGEGRTQAMRLAVTGAMTLDLLRDWQASAQADDTSSGPNQYGYGVALDNNGTGELVPPDQWRAWCAAMAAFAVLAGGTSVGSVIDHSASTARKVDLSTSPAIDVSRWWADVATCIALLVEGPAAMNTALRIGSTPTGRGYFILAADGGVFTYGDAVYRGGLVDYDGPHPPNGPAQDLDVTAVDGYRILTTTGQVFAFGSAGWAGSAETDLNP